MRRKPHWTTENVVVAIFFTFVLSFALFGGAGSCQVRQAEAQVGTTLAERQVIALEKIASEMGRMRRDKCR